MATAFPEQATVPAGHGRRLAAALLDAIFYAIVVGGCAAIGFAIGLAGAAGNDSADDYDGWEDLGWLLVGTFFGLVVGLAVWLMLLVWLVRRPGKRNGQTLGKQLIGIRAVRAGSEQIGVGTALLREILAKGILVGITAAFVSTVLGFLDAGLIGFLVAVAVWYGPAFADDQRRALHDRLCSTRVVDAAGITTPPAAVSDDDLWAGAPAP